MADLLQKRTFRSTSALFISWFLLLVTASTASSDGVPAFPHLRPPSFTSELKQGFYSISWLPDGDRTSTYSMPPQPLFTSALARDLIVNTENPGNTWAELVFPRCASKMSVRCIQSLNIQTSESNSWLPATFKGYLAVTTGVSQSLNRDRYVSWATTDIDLKQNDRIPSDSARSSLWEIRVDGKSQLLMANASIQFDPYISSFSRFRLTLTPIREVEIKDPIEYALLDPENTWCARTGYPDSFFQGNNFHPLTESQPANGNYDYCLVGEKFSSDYKFQFKTQLSPELGELRQQNWLTSRTSETHAYLDRSKKSEPVVAVFEGFPVTVQTGITQIPHTQEGFDAFYSSNSDYQQAVKSGVQTKESLLSNFGIGSQFSGGQGSWGYGWSGIQLWKGTEQYINPTQTREFQIWSFSFIDLANDPRGWIASCNREKDSASGFLGLVSTNATVFVQEPPRIDETGALEFSVAGTHLKQNGEKNIGTYDLSISEALAKCLWGAEFTQASLSLEVVQEDGVSQVATTSIGKRNGQVLFSAAGFHYSVNSIRIKGAKPAKTTNQSSGNNLNPQDQSAASKGKALNFIICKKGKEVKKVRGASAKCPKGFRRTP